MWNDSAKSVYGKVKCLVPVKMREWNVISTSVKLLRRSRGFITVSCQTWQVILWLMSFQWFKSAYSLSLDGTNHPLSHFCLCGSTTWRSRKVILCSCLFAPEVHYHAIRTFTALAEWPKRSKRNRVVQFKRKTDLKYAMFIQSGHKNRLRNASSCMPLALKFNKQLVKH